MTFEEIVDQALAMLQRRGRVAYRTLKRQFDLDEDALEDLKVELIDAQGVAADEDGKVLVWSGSAASPPTPATAPERAPRRAVHSDRAVSRNGHDVLAAPGGGGVGGGEGGLIMGVDRSNGAWIQFRPPVA
jgi:hypothetical protein